MAHTVYTRALRDELLAVGRDRVFLLKVRFSVGIGFGFGIEKLFFGLSRFFGVFKKHFYVVASMVMLPYSLIDYLHANNKYGILIICC
jgi:hypothetical protein